MMVKRAVIPALVLLSALLVGGKSAVAQNEYLIKAALLKHLANPAYVTWPEETPAGEDGNFHIGVFGRNVFAGSLEERLKREKTTHDEDGKNILVHHIKSIEEYRDCDLLFIPRDGSDTFENRLRKAIARTGDDPVLIVGDDRGYARQGAAISFYIAFNRVRLEASRRAAEARGLTLQPGLLRLPQVTLVDE